MRARNAHVETTMTIKANALHDLACVNGRGLAPHEWAAIKPPNPRLIDRPDKIRVFIELMETAYLAMV